eukprot:9642657-Ditylum_brightwellii.AAC.1
MHNWLHVRKQQNLMNATDLGVCLCKTAPIIRDVLTYKLSQWRHLATGNTPSVQFNNLEHNLSLALEEQAEISWENVVKGRISALWGKSQHIFYNEVYPTSNYKKEQWMGKLIT